jgi:undecaprenyl-diphosphatase
MWHSISAPSWRCFLWYFWAEWIRLIRAFFASIVHRSIGAEPDRRLAWMLILGCIPGAVAGVLAESKIEAWFHQANVPIKPSAMIALALIMALMGLLLFLAERLARHIRCLPDMSFRDALLIGLAQAAAIFPGVSRSGSTITAGLALGYQREDAAHFSFLLSAPIIAGAGLKSLVTVISGLKAGVFMPSELLLFPIGFLSAAISGYLVIKFLLGYLRRHSTDIFVYYRWAMSALIIAVVLLRG